MPICFIAGNMLININLILISLSGLILFGKEIFKIRYFLLDKIIFLFFIFLIFTALVNDLFYLNELWWSPNYSTSIRSLLFLKYLFFFLVVKFLVEKDIVDLKLFFLSCAFASLFVCFDIFYQFIFGVDIFGYETLVGFRKLGGPFGDELIAGSYIQRFSVFAIFVIPVFYKNISLRTLKFFLPLILVIILGGLILSGNRMPLLIFIFLTTLIVLFHKQTRKYFLPFILIFTLLFSLAFNFNKKVKDNFDNFYNQIYSMGEIFISGKIQSEDSPQYLKEFASFYDTWLMNKYIGGGIKSFRYYCHIRPNIDKNSKFVCNMHPHNYYLEILTETGLIGFFLVSLIFVLVLYNTFYKKYFTNTPNLINSRIIIPFIFLFIAEIFPVKSTGSFFTTGNSTYIFLIMAILVGLVRNDKFIEKKK
tara:strand:+ start:2746 stop:4005 length:1260 start_codon:yes stop_codon:yes gene_type:complete